LQRVEVVLEWRRRNRGEEKGAEGRRLYRNRKAHDGASCCASFVSYVNGGVRARENGPTAQCGYSASLRVRASHVLRATGIPPLALPAHKAQSTGGTGGPAHTYVLHAFALVSASRHHLKAACGVPAAGADARLMSSGQVIDIPSAGRLHSYDLSLSTLRYTTPHRLPAWGWCLSFFYAVLPCPPLPALKSSEPFDRAIPYLIEAESARSLAAARGSPGTLMGSLTTAACSLPAIDVPSSHLFRLP
jgi:hypothetical protein